MSFPTGNYPLPLEAKPAALSCPCCLPYVVGFCSRTLLYTHKLLPYVKPLMALLLTPSSFSGLEDGKYRACRAVGCSPAFANPFYSPPLLLDNWYPDRHVVVPHCCFDLHFLMASNTEYLFMCLLAIHISFLKKCLFKPLTHFWIFFFFLVC